MNKVTNYGEFLGKTLLFNGEEVTVRAIDAKNEPMVTLTVKATLEHINLDWDAYKEWIDRLS